MPDWVRLYRGLWGFYMQDPFAGEDAPAGPMYNRDGSVRRAWYDPVGWAGLEKVPPPSRALERAFGRRAAILNRRDELNDLIEHTHTELMRLGVEMDAMRGLPHLKPLFEQQAQQMEALRTQLDERAQLARMKRCSKRWSTISNGCARAITGRSARISGGHRPLSDEQLRLGLSQNCGRRPASGWWRWRSSR